MAEQIEKKVKCTGYADAMAKATEYFKTVSTYEFHNKARKLLQAAGCKCKLYPNNKDNVTAIRVAMEDKEGKVIYPHPDSIALLAWKEKASGIWYVQTTQSMHNNLQAYWAYVYCVITNPFGLEKRDAMDVDTSELSEAVEQSPSASYSANQGGGYNTSNGDAPSELNDIMSGKK